MQIEFEIGSHISAAAALLADAANEHGSAEGVFNGITIHANAGTPPAQIEADWLAQSRARAEQYRNSPDGLAAAKREQEERAALQATHDALMKRLPALDFKNKLAVIDWLCAMQEPSDRRGVIVRRATICAVFAKNGFLPNANCGEDYQPNNCDNVFRYLVGQCLSGLSDGPAIHGIIHKFAGEWRTKFCEQLSH